MTYLGTCVLEAIACNQATIALASGEAELSAINRGAAGGILLRNFL